MKNELRALHHQAVNLDVCWDDGIRIKNAKKDTFFDRKKKMKGPKGYGFVRITNKVQEMKHRGGKVNKKGLQRSWGSISNAVRICLAMSSCCRISSCTFCFDRLEC